MPISTFPRHDYDEDEYLLKPAGLRDTHSEGKVSMGACMMARSTVSIARPFSMMAKMYHKNLSTRCGRR
jgi:hypothetical protein